MFFPGRGGHLWIRACHRFHSPTVLLSLVQCRDKTIRIYIQLYLSLSSPAKTDHEKPRYTCTADTICLPAINIESRIVRKSLPVIRSGGSTGASAKYDQSPLHSTSAVIQKIV